LEKAELIGSWLQERLDSLDWRGFPRPVE